MKLENIFIGKKNKLIIGDFGFANQLKEGKFMKRTCGTIRYTDPEILRKRAYSGEMADLWGCGVILYALVCGRLPFDNDVYGVLLREIIQSHV